jgi:hypothetical protein
MTYIYACGKERIKTVVLTSPPRAEFVLTTLLCSCLSVSRSLKLVRINLDKKKDVHWQRVLLSVFYCDVPQSFTPVWSHTITLQLRFCEWNSVPWYHSEIRTPTPMSVLPVSKWAKRISEWTPRLRQLVFKSSSLNCALAAAWYQTSQRAWWSKIIGFVAGRMVYSFIGFSWCTWSMHR